MLNESNCFLRNGTGFEPKPRVAAAHRTATHILAFASLCLVLAALAGPAVAAAPKGYQQTNMISNGAVDAKVINASFINPWGVSLGTDFWINTTGSGQDYVVTGSGDISFQVTIPPAAGKGQGLPTGTVVTTGIPEKTFLLPDKSSPQFLFCTIDGTVSGWSGGSVLIAVNNHKAGDVYTDMALLNGTKGSFVLLANAGADAGVQAYDGAWKRAMETEFKDPQVPAGYAPFGIHVLAGTVYVTYSPSHGPLGPGKGFVDAFSETGKFIGRVIPTGDKLNAPWGMALAPAKFGEFSGDLLVGNFGDGTISAYDPVHYGFKGKITDGNGNVIANSGLWEIAFGQTDPALGNPDTLYFAAGIDGEAGGLFGTITAASSKVTKTKTTLISDANPGQKGESVTFTALVQPDSGWGEPEGHVIFSVDGKEIWTSPVDSTSHATATAAKLAVGKYTVTADYTGDENFSSSLGTIKQTVEAPTTATPIFTPAVRSYSTAQSVTITDATPHATIYYTTNGSTPTTKSAVYSKAIAVSSTTTIKTFAAAPDLAASPTVDATYTISSSSPTAAPDLSPGGGTFSSAQSVSISDATKGAVIYYTTNGTMPTTKSAVFSKPISVAANMTINAMAIAPGWTQSTVTSANYTISTGGGW
jgi:uncharacterized protein (TIGR03118 family)